MKKSRHFDFDYPIHDVVIEDCKEVRKHVGDLNLSGVGYFRDGEIWYDLDTDVYVKAPKDSIDYSPIAQRVPRAFLAIMKAKGFALPEDDDVNGAIIHHLEKLFSTEHLDIVTDLVQDDKAA